MTVIQESSLILRAVVVEPYRARLVDDDFKMFTPVPIDPHGEGATWCYDWYGEAVDALRAAVALG